MQFSESQMIFGAVAGMFASVIFMHLTKRNSWTVSLYALQSFLVVLLLSGSLVKEFSLLLTLTICAMFIVKVIVAPKFFYTLIHRHEVKFSASSYLNGPMTLIILAALTGLTRAKYFSPLTTLSPLHADTILLTVSMMLISVFLIINKKGALSQMIGLLSLEDAIVAFAAVTGLEQTPALQLGIVFDIGIWILIATVFVSMMYHAFGTLDVSEHTRMKED